MANDKIKRTHKDTFFRGLFKQNEHFVDLYKECSNRLIDKDAVKTFTLNPKDRAFPLIKGSGLSNDVSKLTVDNKLIILSEHQSTPNPKSLFTISGLLD